MNNSEPLEERIKQYYEQQALPEDALNRLKERIEQPLLQQSQPVDQPLDQPPQSLSLITRLSDGIKALLSGSNAIFQPAMKPLALLTALILGIALTLFILPSQSNHQRLELVAAEIALNHAKQFDAEFSTATIDSLADRMPLLDFQPITPKRIALERYQIVGGRYCTIDNAIAVQIHLEDDGKKAYTLYEFRMPSSLRLKEETVIYVDDIQVTLWHEGEVVMGLANRL